MVIDNIISALSESPGKEKHPLLKYGPPLLTALLVVWMASKLVNLTWLLLDKPVYSTQIDATRIAGPTSGPAKIEYSETVDRIAGTNLFGEYVEPPTGGEALPILSENVPDVDLRNLILKGTVASTTDNNGLAIIEKDGEEHVFTVRDTVAPGYELERVFADRIHLLHAGVIKKLMLPKLKDDDSPAANRRPTNNRRTTSRQPSLARNAASARSAVTNQAPAKLGDLLRPQPVFQNGKQLGYRVYPGRKRDQFKALGLKAGDLVTEINGTPLDDPSRGLEIFRSMNDSTQVSVTVERNGAQTSLVLDTSQLNIAGDQ